MKLSPGAIDIALMIIRDAAVLFAKPGMLPEKVLADWVAQARKADMEKIRRETAKNQPTSRAATG